MVAKFVRYRICVPAIAGIAALCLIYFGTAHTSYKVYESPPDDPNDLFALYENISDPQMIFNATFGGVNRAKDGSLYYTYDPLALQEGPKACPT